MGAAPVLIMLAAVGVDYGWQPDGTTSSRGDNIEYIVQISPDQLQQIRSIGEITSSIDPSVQGRVSKIVVRVGNGPLPKIAGRSTAASNAQGNLPSGAATSVNSDQDAIPQPELRDSIATRTTTSNESRGRTTESLMKPDPQGTGGFALPQSLQSGDSSAFDQVRNGANETATQFGTQVRSAIEGQANALGQTAADASTRTTDSLQNSFATPSSPITGNPSTASVPTGPVTARDDRWNTLSAQTNSTAGQGPSTDPVAANARTAPWSTGASQGTATNGLTAPNLATPGFTTPGLSTPNAANDPRSLSPNFGGSAADYRNPAATASSNVPARDATDPAWSGYGTSNNFGTVPGGLSVPQTGYNSQTVPPSSSVASSNIGDSRAASNSGFWQDKSGNWRNAKNQLVNSDGQPVDIYGRPVDENNQLLPDNRLAHANDLRANSSTSMLAPSLTGSATNPLGRTSPFDQSEYAQSPSLQSPFQTNLTSAQLAQQRTEQQLFEAQRELLLLKEREKAQTRLINFDAETTSASDLRSAANQLAAKAERDHIDAAAASATSRTKSVAAQPFFNFVLLISLVGNFYLIYETSNLRRKFRSMISSVRSSKVLAQPATN